MKKFQNKHTQYYTYNLTAIATNFKYKIASFTSYLKQVGVSLVTTGAAPGRGKSDWFEILVMLITVSMTGK